MIECERNYEKTEDIKKITILFLYHYTSYLSPILVILPVI